MLRALRRGARACASRPCRGTRARPGRRARGRARRRRRQRPRRSASTSCCSRRRRWARSPSATGGGSSTMPHKRNPVGAVLARACARARARARRRCSSRASSRSTSAQPAPGRRSGTRSRRALAAAGGAAAGDPRSLAGLEVDASGCARTSSRRPLAEALALGASRQPGPRTTSARPMRSSSARSRCYRRRDLDRIDGTGAPFSCCPARSARRRRSGIRSCRRSTDVASCGIDHPGHGDSPLAGRAGRSATSAASRSSMQLGDERARSSGCRSAARSACGSRSAPERVDRLVLACTAARFGDPAQWLDRAALVRAEGIEAIVDAVLARWFTPAFRGVERVPRACCSAIDPPRATRVAAKRSRAGTSAATARRVARAGARRSPAPTIRRHRPAPSRRSPPEIPGARFEVIDGAAHIANVERADVFNRLIEEHLDERRDRATE